MGLAAAWFFARPNLCWDARAGHDLQQYCLRLLVIGDFRIGARTAWRPLLRKAQLDLRPLDAVGGDGRRPGGAMEGQLAPGFRLDFRTRRHLAACWSLF